MVRVSCACDIVVNRLFLVFPRGFSDGHVHGDARRSCAACRPGRRCPHGRNRELPMVPCSNARVAECFDCIRIQATARVAARGHDRVRQAMAGVRFEAVRKVYGDRHRGAADGCLYGLS